MQLDRAMLIGVPVVAMVAIIGYLRLHSPEVAGPDTGIAANEPRLPVASARSGAASVDDVSVLRGELASLRAELLQLRREQIAKSGSSVGNGPQPQSGPQNATQSNGESPRDPRTKELAIEEAAREHQARIASIDAAFRREVIDPTWSANTSSRIQSVLSSEEMGHMKADSIDCRSNSCRVELYDDGSGRLGKNMPIMALQLAGTLPSLVANSVERSDGGRSLVLYLSHQSQGTAPVTR